MSGHRRRPLCSRAERRHAHVREYAREYENLAREPRPPRGILGRPVRGRPGARVGAWEDFSRLVETGGVKFTAVAGVARAAHEWTTNRHRDNDTVGGFAGSVMPTAHHDRRPGGTTTVVANKVLSLKNHRVGMVDRGCSE